MSCRGSRQFIKGRDFFTSLYVRDNRVNPDLSFHPQHVVRRVPEPHRLALPPYKRRETGHAQISRTFPCRPHRQDCDTCSTCGSYSVHQCNVVQPDLTSSVVDSPTTGRNEIVDDRRLMFLTRAEKLRAIDNFVGSNSSCCYLG